MDVELNPIKTTNFATRFVFTFLLQKSSFLKAPQIFIRTAMNSHQHRRRLAQFTVCLAAALLLAVVWLHKSPMQKWNFNGATGELTGI